MPLPLCGGGRSHWHQFSHEARVGEGGGSVQQPLQWVEGDAWKTILGSSPALNPSSPDGPTKPQPLSFSNSCCYLVVDLVKRGIHFPLTIWSNFHCSCLKGYLFTEGDLIWLLSCENPQPYFRFFFKSFKKISLLFFSASSTTLFFLHLKTLKNEE